MGDLRILELLKDGQLGALDGVVGGGEDGVHLGGHQGIHRGGDLVGIGARLLLKGDALGGQVVLGLLNGLGGGPLRLGVQQTHLFQVGVGGQHQLHHHLGVQRVAGTGDLAAGGIHIGHNTVVDGIGDSGEDDGDAGVLSGSHGSLDGGGGDGDNHVHLVSYHLGGDGLKGGTIPLAAGGVVRIVEGDAQLSAQPVQLGLEAVLNLVQGGVVHKLHDAHLVGLLVNGLLGAGAAALGLRSGAAGGLGAVPAAAGGQGECHGQRQSQGHQLLHSIGLFHVGFLQIFRFRRQMRGPCQGPFCWSIKKQPLIPHGTRAALLRYHPN